MKELLKHLNQRPIAFYPIYVDVVGSITGAVLLSQLMYWFSKSDKFYKTDAEIQKETRIPEKSLKTAKRRIKSLKFVNVTLEGIPAKTFYKINWDAYADEISHTEQKNTSESVVTSLNKRDKQDSIERDEQEWPKGTNCEGQKGQTLPINTKTTTKTTTYIKTLSYDVAPDGANHDGDFKKSLQKEKPDQPITSTGKAGKEKESVSGERERKPAKKPLKLAGLKKLPITPENHYINAAIYLYDILRPHQKDKYYFKEADANKWADSLRILEKTHGRDLMTAFDLVKWSLENIDDTGIYLQSPAFLIKNKGANYDRMLEKKKVKERAKEKEDFRKNSYSSGVTSPPPYDAAEEDRKRMIRRKNAEAMLAKILAEKEKIKDQKNNENVNIG